MSELDMEKVVAADEKKRSAQAAGEKPEPPVKYEIVKATPQPEAAKVASQPIEQAAPRKILPIHQKLRQRVYWVVATTTKARVGEFLRFSAVEFSPVT